MDSYDVATGGVDCGTGIAPAMETARMLMAAGAKPKRSIVFYGMANLDRKLPAEAVYKK